MLERASTASFGTSACVCVVVALWCFDLQPGSQLLVQTRFPAVVLGVVLILLQGGRCSNSQLSTQGK